MKKNVSGTVAAVSTQWWLKVNTKAIRSGPTDGAVFPHVVKVRYTAEGKTYTKRKWLAAGVPVPDVGSKVVVSYEEGAPSKARILG